MFNKRIIIFDEKTHRRPHEDLHCISHNFIQSESFSKQISEGPQSPNFHHVYDYGSNFSDKHFYAKNLFITIYGI